MTTDQIQEILHRQAYPGGGKGQLVETHISWVILTPTFAYKIKKPLRFSFLDFSTLEQRRFFCAREVALNSRLTKGVYLQVLPICHIANGSVIGSKDGKVIDYAIQMKRLDNERQMNRMLERDAVQPRHMIQLADQLAAFHDRAEVIRQPFDVEELHRKFADLADLQPFLARHLGEDAGQVVGESVGFSETFLHRLASRIAERQTLGFIIDGHGDLHSRNIFLLDEPVIFDCIEFNDSFRFVDVLDELAFFCMDLDFYQKEDLARIFLDRYLEKNNALRTKEDHQLFHYYKLYRANVRLKVISLQARQEKEGAEQQKWLSGISIYFQLFKRYLDFLLH